MATQKTSSPSGPPRLPPVSEPFSDEALLLSDAPAPGRAAHRPEALQVECITDWTALEALEPEWLALADAALEPNPFYERCLLLPALRAFGPGKDLHVLCVFASNGQGARTLCGLFPLLRRRARLELWKHPYCYLTTPLVHRAFARAAVGKLCDHLCDRTGLVRLEDIRGQGNFRQLLQEELNRRGWTSRSSAFYARAFLKVAASADAFLERAVNTKRRGEFRRQRARLAEQGRLTVDELVPGADPTPWIQEFLELEAAGWKGREGVAAALQPGHRDYLEAALPQAHACGKLMMLALRLDGAPVALKVNLLSGTGSFAFKIAFDERFARHSPGVLLELENVRRVHAQPGLAWMDSCAAPNRFLLNHLWPDRRELQTLFFATGKRLPSLAVTLLPLLQWLRARLR